MIIWKQSMELVLLIYKITHTFPKQELFGLASQMRRSAVSIPSNIAEGKGRKSDKTFIYFLKIALGSLFELQTQINISHRLNYISDETFSNFNDKADSLSKMIISVINKLKANC